MKLAYFRKSNFSFDETLNNFKNKAKELGFEVLGEASLSGEMGVVFQICSCDWLSNLVASERNLFAFLPSSVLFLKEDKSVLVGVGDASVLAKLSSHPSVLDISRKMDSKLKKLVDETCGVGPLKITKVRLYATTTCPYCKMEASFLDQRKIDYDYVLVDLDTKAAEEMVASTGQMGVPVTEIVYEDNDKEYIIGFDKSRLEEIFSIKN